MGTIASQNHQPRDCLLNRLFRRRSKKTPKLRATGPCAWNSPGTGESHAQMASTEENATIWWRHHGSRVVCYFKLIISGLKFMYVRDVGHHWFKVYRILADTFCLIKLDIREQASVRSESKYGEMRSTNGTENEYVACKMTITMSRPQCVKVTLNIISDFH